MRLYFLLLLFAFGLQAQNNPVASGGEAIGANGTTTYSVGQIVYQSGRNEAFSVSQGNQQPFEIIALAKEGFVPSGTNISIYPNPTYSGFYLLLPETETGTPTYQLLDISGKTIKTGNLNALQNFVPTDGLTSRTYILKIENASAKYTSYKIIKR